MIAQEIGISYFLDWEYKPHKTLSQSESAQQKYMSTEIDFYHKNINSCIMHFLSIPSSKTRVHWMTTLCTQVNTAGAPLGELLHIKFVDRLMQRRKKRPFLHSTAANIHISHKIYTLSKLCSALMPRASEWVRERGSTGAFCFLWESRLHAQPETKIIFEVQHRCSMKTSKLRRREWWCSIKVMKAENYTENSASRRLLATIGGAQTDLFSHQPFSANQNSIHYRCAIKTSREITKPRLNGNLTLPWPSSWFLLLEFSIRESFMSHTIAKLENAKCHWPASRKLLSNSLQYSKCHQPSNQSIRRYRHLFVS